MTATQSRPSLSSNPASPAIDFAQALWASRELESMIEHLGIDSPVAIVLRHARREIVSLTMNSASAATVVGPFRVAA